MNWNQKIFEVAKQPRISIKINKIEVEYDKDEHNYYDCGNNNTSNTSNFKHNKYNIYYDNTINKSFVVD